MRALAIAIVVASATFVPALAGSEEDAVIKPMQIFVEGINVGDVRAAVAECAS
jgi:hypothetical protein